jgi:hypothetical protein
VLVVMVMQQQRIGGNAATVTAADEDLLSFESKLC